MVKLDHRTYLASVWAILVVLGGLGGCWVVMLNCRDIWPLLRRFWWFLGVIGWLCLIVGRIWPLCMRSWWFWRSRGLLGGYA